MRAGLNLLTLEEQQLANLLEREPKPLCALDEPDPLDVPRAEQTKAALGSRRPLQEALLFIESDGIDSQTGLLGDSANLNPAPSHMISGYTLESAPESRGQIVLKSVRRFVSSAPFGRGSVSARRVQEE